METISECSIPFHSIPGISNRPIFNDGTCCSCLFRSVLTDNKSSDGSCASLCLTCDFCVYFFHLCSWTTKIYITISRATAKRRRNSFPDLGSKTVIPKDSKAEPDAQHPSPCCTYIHIHQFYYKLIFIDSYVYIYVVALRFLLVIHVKAKRRNGCVVKVFSDVGGILQ